MHKKATQGRKILLLSFYFEPDIGPGPFRNTSLVDKMKGYLLPGDRLDVLTTLPNRYASFDQQAPAQEQQGGVTIRRINLPAHQSGMKDQARAFHVFARAVRRITRGEDYDLVFASSSRLMTAALGAYIARRSKALLYLDIRDIFTETMREVLGSHPGRFLLPGFDLLEAWTIRRADRVNLVSPGFLEHFEAICDHDYRLFTNGIDDLFMSRSFRKAPGRTKERVVLYAGNIGDGQGLHRVVPKAAKLLEGNVIFRLVGDGGRRTELEQSMQEAAVRNVELLDPMPREALCDLYAEADVLFLHLNDYKAFHRVLPSKPFEYLATQKSVLAGVSGCAADFLRRETTGTAIFSPCDADGLVKALHSLPEGPVDRSAFMQCYK